MKDSACVDRNFPVTFCRLEEICMKQMNIQNNGQETANQNLYLSYLSSCHSMILIFNVCVLECLLERSEFYFRGDLNFNSGMNPVGPNVRFPFGVSTFFVLRKQ